MSSFVVRVAHLPTASVTNQANPDNTHNSRRTDSLSRDPRYNASHILSLSKRPTPPPIVSPFKATDWAPMGSITLDCRLKTWPVVALGWAKARVDRPSA